jgi:CxxC-x17-CxxC domain-containing protein
MAFVDKTIKCRECEQEFIFTAGEQEFYAEKGFVNEPQRCKACRSARKQAKGELTTVICADCGISTEVPFVPRTDRPVYCRDCFAKHRENQV